MKGIHLDLCYTSPLSRARETAQIILGDRQIPVYDDPRIEEISFGRYEGLKIGGEDPQSRLFGRFFSDTEIMRPRMTQRPWRSFTGGQGHFSVKCRPGRT